MTEPLYGDYVYSNKVTGQEALVRREISLYMPHQVGIQISDGTQLIDPSDITVRVYKRDDWNTGSDPNGVLAVTFPFDAVTREDVGVYSFPIQPFLTQTKGLINVIWEYTIGDSNFVNTYKEFFIVNDFMPTYNGLKETQQALVDSVMVRFADLYDSREGGPHLKDEWQTHFNAERVAQLLSIAVGTINYYGQPITRYVVGSVPGTAFPLKDYGILERALYLEVLKHLVRSYTERPVIQGTVSVAWDDRINYAQRWKDVLAMEMEDFKTMLKFYKRSMLNLGGGNLLVAGGIFGTTMGIGALGSIGYTAALRGLGKYYPVSITMSVPGAGGA